MKLGVHYGSSTDFSAILEDVVALEAAGADLVWLGESYGYDVISALGALSARTRTVGLGSAVVPVQTRSSALIAMTMLGLDALSDGRALLGLGTSGPQVIEGLHDSTFGPPLARIRRVITDCRTLWCGDRLQPSRMQRNGVPYKALKLIHASPRSRIPIFLAGIGPKTVSLAAELAEGWFPAFFWPDRFDQVWGESLEAGRAARPEDVGPLEISVSVSLAVGDGAQSELARHRNSVAHYLGGMGTRDVNFYLQLADRYGVGREASRVQALYLEGKKDAAAEAVPQEMVEGTSLIGSKEEVLKRLMAYARAGVTALNLVPAGRTLAERVEHMSVARSLVDQLQGLPDNHL
jgi:F420-dependent oxidoreductase-like protein